MNRVTQSTILSLSTLRMVPHFILNLLNKKDIDVDLCHTVFSGITVGNNTSGKLYYLIDYRGYMKYLLDGLKKNDSIVIMPNFVRYPHKLFDRIIHFFLGRVPLNAHIVSLLTGEKLFSWLPTLNSNDKIILQDITSLRSLQTVAWLSPNHVSRFLYISNCLRFVYKPDRVEKTVKKIKRMGFKIVTFDPEDAKIYGLIHTVQYFRFPELKQTETLYDFFFCGRRKERGLSLDNLKKALESKGFRCRFDIPEENKRWMSYEEYIDVLQSSRCIIDIAQEGQVGFTRRPIEALFFNKKLITNNVEIMKFDFYRNNNIFILGKDKLEDIDSFMETDIEIIPDEIKRKYDINTWIENFR